MKRIFALVLGALAAVTAVRLTRRRCSAGSSGEDLVRDSGEAMSVTTDDQAQELRRKLDEARESGSTASVDHSDGDTLGEARLADEGSYEPLAPSGEEGLEQLSERRSRVHGRARKAAETMRSNSDPDAA